MHLIQRNHLQFELVISHLFGPRSWSFSILFTYPSDCASDEICLINEPLPLDQRCIEWWTTTTRNNKKKIETDVAERVTYYTSHIEHGWKRSTERKSVKKERQKERGTNIKQQKIKIFQSTHKIGKTVQEAKEKERGNFASVCSALFA